MHIYIHSRTPIHTHPLTYTHRLYYQHVKFLNFLLHMIANAKTIDNICLLEILYYVVIEMIFILVRLTCTF